MLGDETEEDLVLDDETDLVLGGTSNNEEDSELGGTSSDKKSIGAGRRRSGAEALQKGPVRQKGLAKDHFESSPSRCDHLMMKSGNSPETPHNSQ